MRLSKGIKDTFNIHSIIHPFIPYNKDTKSSTSFSISNSNPISIHSHKSPASAQATK